MYLYKALVRGVYTDTSLEFIISINDYFSVFNWTPDNLPYPTNNN